MSHLNNVKSTTYNARLKKFRQKEKQLMNKPLLLIALNALIFRLINTVRFLHHSNWAKWIIQIFKPRNDEDFYKTFINECYDLDLGYKDNLDLISDMLDISITVIHRGKKICSYPHPPQHTQADITVNLPGDFCESDFRSWM